MVTIEEDVVDGVLFTAVWAGGIVPGIGSEAGGVAGVECVAGDELKSSRLVCAGLGGENPLDKWMKG
jgi:hypothetical protein